MIYLRKQEDLQNYISCLLKSQLLLQKHLIIAIIYIPQTNKRLNKRQVSLTIFLDSLGFPRIIAQHGTPKPQQIININMQRKKSDIVDYKLGCSPQNYNQLLHHIPQSDCNAQLTHQSFFMKYASSIIQVINEDKLQRSNHHAAEGEAKNHVFEISEVDYYQAENLPKNCQHKPTVSNNYNHFGEGFKKKNNKRHILPYNFTNITLFLNYLNKFQKVVLQKSFNSVKATAQKRKITIKNPKSKSSFHSDYTTSTSNEDQGLKKLNNLQQIVKKNEDIKQSIDQMKGWLQFKLLILKSQAFKQILCISKHTASAKKEGNLVSNFGLSSLQHDQSVSLVNQEEQESLVYTADQNFQFSQKEITVSTPQKTSLELKFNIYKDPAIAISTYGSINNHESVVEVYKLSRVNYNKLGECKDTTIKQAIPALLSLDKYRKHPVVKINTFQLPLISEFYLKDDQIPVTTQIPLKKDILVPNQVEYRFNCDQIKKQFQEIKFFTNQNKNSLKKSQHKLKVDFHGDQSSTLMTQLNKNTNCQYAKHEKQAQLNAYNKAQIINQEAFKIGFYQKKGVHKVQDYYFPGAQSKINKLVTSKSETRLLDGKNITKEDQRINFQASDKKLGIVFPKKVRFEESRVDNFVQNQNNIKQRKKEVIVVSQQKKECSKMIFETKSKPKISVGYTSPESKMCPISQNINSYVVGQNDKRKPFYSPPPNFQSFQHFNQAKKPQVMAKTIQQEYNQIKPSDSKRFLANDLGIPQQAQTQHKNIYQLNYLNNQSKQAVNHMASHQKAEARNTAVSSPYKQIPQGMNIKINNKIINNRPNSRLASPSPPSIHLNIPIKSEVIPYGFATSRSNQQKKNPIQSPETQRVNFPSTNFHQQMRPNYQNYRRQDYNQEYFARNCKGNGVEQQPVHFNNKYYTSGVTLPSRPNRMISPTTIQPIFTQDYNTRKVFVNQRPHSSFRQTSERFNIFSNYSPLESQLQHIQRSNNFTSRNSSQLSRPKSMNEKIHVTMKRER